MTLKIDLTSMKEAIQKCSFLVGNEVKNEATRLLTLDMFTYDPEKITSRFVINFTGKLSSSSNVVEVENGSEITWSAPYASDIEFGSDPHSVSKDEILYWVQTKTSRNLPKAGDDAERFADGVVDKIGREGTYPRPFVRTAIDHINADDKVIS